MHGATYQERVLAAGMLATDPMLGQWRERLECVMAKRDLPVLQELLVQAFLIGKVDAIRGLQQDLAALTRASEVLDLRLACVTNAAVRVEEARQDFDCLRTQLDVLSERWGMGGRRG